METKFKFTVFTPTFNRAHTLQRVFDSLMRQTYRNFEWLIVDDGSSDGTQELVEKWMDAAWFLIRYEWQPNAGKHFAFNRGVELAEGELFLSIDSDDACVPHALERFIFHWQNIPTEGRSRFSAVTVLSENQHGQLNGDRFPKDILDSDPRELVYRYRLRGDKWGFHVTEVLRRFPFPLIEGLSYVPESIVWCAIGKRYRTRYVNERLLINFRLESSKNSLSSQSLATSSKGFAIREEIALTEDIDLFYLAPWVFAKRAANWTRFRLLAGQGFPSLKRLGSSYTKALVIAMAPLGVLMYLKDCVRSQS